MVVRHLGASSEAAAVGAYDATAPLVAAAVPLVSTLLGVLLAVVLGWLATAGSPTALLAVLANCEAPAARSMAPAAPAMPTLATPAAPIMRPFVPNASELISP